jgi:NAD-dependent dihydropyrimidine dehydrogenase PreA subunit
MNDKTYSKFEYKKSYQTKSSDKSYNYTPQQKAKHDNSCYNTSKYPQQQKNDKSTKQEKPRSVYKYKIERDKSGNCSYVLEEPEQNSLKFINDYEIKCVYPNNGTKYYKNVNIYNYKKKIII